MVHVAVPGVPDVTVVVPQPVFPLHVTVPVRFCGFACPLRPFTCPYCPLIVAVNVTGWLYTDGFALELTAVLEVARIAVVVSVTCAAAA